MKKIITALLIVFIVITNVAAQQSNTTYFMDWVPQSSNVNPAKQLPCKFFIGAPGVAPAQFNFVHSGFTFNDIFQYAPVSKDIELVTFLHPQGIGQEKFLKSLRKVNYVTADASASIASFGFRANSYYFTLNVSERAMSRFTYPKDLFSLIINGNDSSDVFNFKHLAFDAMAFREYAFGLSQKIDHQWTIGFKAKVLFGHAAVFTDNNVQLKTQLEQWSIAQSSLSINTSLPMYTAQTDTNGNFTGFEEKEEYDPIQDFIKHKNLGGALDFGAIYRLNRNWEFSASIIDLGGINWSNDIINLSQEQSVTFKGYRLSLNEDENSEFLNELLDSFKLNYTSETFSTGLPLKTYIGARWFANEKVSFGFLNKNEFTRGRLRPQFTFSGNLNDKFISTVINYTIMNNSFFNFGLGLNFKIGPLNMYIISDNIPIRMNSVTLDEESKAILLPYKNKTYNLRFGLNLIFGCKDIGNDKPYVL